MFLAAGAVLLFLPHLCDSILGGHLQRSRNRVETSNYRMVVSGGIVSDAEPMSVDVRSTSLGIDLVLRGEVEKKPRSLVVEVSNLPRDLVVEHRGPGVVTKGGDSVIAVVSLKRRPVEFRLHAHPRNEGPNFTFWVGGDSRGRPDLLLELFKLAMERRPRFVVLEGDLVGNGLWWQYDELMEMLDNFPVPVVAVPGNHDLELCGRRYFTRYLAPDHYAFSYGDSLFVVLDTNREERGQLDWLNRVLGEHSYRHRFVFVHKPPFDPRPGHNHCMKNRAFANGLLQAVARHHVDVLFCSHIHTFIQTSYRGVRIVVTGGLGAHRKEPLCPFHYVKVEVKGERVSLKMVPLK